MFGKRKLYFVIESLSSYLTQDTMCSVWEYTCVYDKSSSWRRIYIKKYTVMLLWYLRGILCI